MSDSPPRWPPPPAPAETDWEAIEPREVLDYDAETETYRASFERDRTTISEAVVLVVAAVTQTVPLELPSLYSALDTETVELLVDSSITGSQSGDLHVSFTYADCDVTVRSYGVIAVRPLEEDATD